MKVIGVMRILFQVLALGIFVFQMQNSIRKYINKPVVSQSSVMTLDDIRKPVIYICQDAQFNYKIGEDNGYKYFTHYTVGHISATDNITWKGKFGNISFQQLTELIFEYDYGTLVTLTSETGDDSKFIDVDTDLDFMIPFGFCKKVAETKVGLLAESQKSNVVILVDPNKESKILIPDLQNGRFEFGPTTTGEMMGFIYRIELELIDYSLHDEELCIDYEKIGLSYGDCIENFMKANFIKWYGCLPPWFNDSSGMTCEVDKEIEAPTTEMKTLIRDEYFNLLHGLEVKFFKSCLPPCLTMKLKSSLRGRFSNNLNEAFIEIIINDEINVNKDVYAYDMFSLIVDLGSALGLRLGLSALSIFDSILDFHGVFRKRLSKSNTNVQTVQSWS